MKLVRKLLLTMLLLLGVVNLLSAYIIKVKLKEEWIETIHHRGVSKGGYFIWDPVKGIDVWIKPYWDPAPYDEEILHPAIYEQVMVPGRKPGDIFDLTDEEKARIRQALEEKLARRARAAGIKDAADAVKRIVDRAVIVNAGGTDTTKNGQNGVCVGDPVRIATGEFVTESVDLQLARLIVSRYYESGKEITGSMGRGWGFSHDRRLIMGVRPGAAGEYEQLKAKLVKLEAILVNLNIEEVERELAPLLSRANSVVSELEGALHNLTTCGYQNSPEIRQAKEEASGLLAKAVAYRDELLGFRGQARSCYSEIKLMRDSLKEMVEAAGAEAEIAKVRSERNRFVIWEGTLESYRDTGNNTVTFIDSRGTPHLFYLLTGPDYRSTAKLSDGTTNYYPLGSKGESSLPGGPELTLLPDGSYLLKERDGSEMSFNHYGLLLEEKDRRGNSLHYIYDVENRLQETVDSYGRRIAFSRDSRQRVTAITDPAGRAWHYSYDSKGQLASVSDPAGDMITYSYTNGLLTGIGKPDGSGRSYRYSEIEGKMRVTGTTDEEGGSETFTYNLKESWTDYTNDAGIKERYYYNERMLTTRVVYGDAVDGTKGTYVSMEYDADNNLIKQRDERGGVSHYSYDGDHNLLTATDPAGVRVSWTYDSENRVTSTTDGEGNMTLYSYDAQGNLKEKSYADGVKESFSYDSRGRLSGFIDGNGHSTTYVHDRFGNLAEVKDGLGQSSYYSYDMAGNLTEYTDRAGNKTFYQYNSDGKPVKVTDAAGNNREYHYDSRKDLVRVVDELGGVTTIEYDRRHNPLLVTDAAGNVSSYSYNMQGKVVSQTTGGTTIKRGYDNRGRLTYVQEESGLAKASYSYTATGQLDKVTDAAGNVTSYEYNSVGRLTTVVNPLGQRETIEYDRNYRPVKTVNAAGDVTLYRYDSRGRVVAKTLPNKATLEYSYDSVGNLLSETDPLGNSTKYGYDANNRLLTVIDDSAVNKKLTTFSYGANGKVTAEVDALGNKRAYRYDNMGRLVTVTLPTGAEAFYSYDRAGRLAETTDAAGIKTAYERDPLGRVTARVDGEGNRTTYDYNGLGRVKSITDALGGKSILTYNRLGEVTDAVNPKGDKVSYEYDVVGNHVATTNGEGERTGYSYDALGRITAVTNPLGETTTYGYDLRGYIKEETVNGKAYSYTYGAFGQLLKETNRAGDSRTFSYNLKGQVSSATDFNGKLTTYEYDERGLLTKANYADGSYKTLRYDELGRPVETATKELKELYQYNSLGQTMRATTQYLLEDRVERIDYSYDRAGRRTGMTVDPLGRAEKTSYHYDALGRLAELRDSSNRVTTMSYDALGRLTAKALPNGTGTNYHYDPAGNISKLLNWEGKDRKVTQSFGYTYDNAGRKKFEVEGDGNITAYKYDALGRVSEVYYPFSYKANQAVDERYDSGLEFIEYPEGKVEAPKYDHPIIQIREGVYKQKTIPRIDYSKVNKFPIVDEKFSFTAEESAELEALYPQILEHDNSQYAESSKLKPHTRVFLREQFTFDANSNITKVTNGWGSIDYKYDAANRLVQKGLVNYSYDKNGNLLTEELAGKYSKSFSYDQDNRLKEAIESRPNKGLETTHTYNYDNLGRKRSTKKLKRLFGSINEDKIEHYSYDGFNMIRESHTELDSMGTVLPHKEIDYRYVGDKLLYSDEYSNMSKQYRNRLYYHTNTTDTLTMATDDKGRLVEEFVYSIYGTNLRGQIDKVNGIGYNSKRFSELTDGWQYEFREYMPGIKQFTTDDPIRSTNNWRTLTGGYNDPVNYVDLLGLDPAVAKEALSNPQNWEAALRGATTAYLIGKSAASSGAAVGGTGAVAASGSLAFPLIGVAIVTSIAYYATLKAEEYFIEERYRVRDQMESGEIPYEHHPDDDEMGDRNFVGPSINDTFNSLRNSNNGPDIDKINRDIQKDAYGTNNNIGQTPEEAREELSEPEVGTSEKTGNDSSLKFGSNDLVLGIDEHWHNYISKYGGNYYYQLSKEKGDANQIMDAMYKSDKIRFAVDDFNFRRLRNVDGEFTDGVPNGGFTSWEMWQINRNPELKQKTRFYKRGEDVTAEVMEDINNNCTY